MLSSNEVTEIFYLIDEFSKEFEFSISKHTRKEFEDIYIALSELSSRHKELTKPRNPIGYIKKER